MVNNHSAREDTHCHNYSIQLAVRVPFCASSHWQDRTHHGFVTQVVEHQQEWEIAHDGLIRWPIADVLPWDGTRSILNNICFFLHDHKINANKVISVILCTFLILAIWSHSTKMWWTVRIHRQCSHIIHRNIMIIKNMLRVSLNIVLTAIQIHWHHTTIIYMIDALLIGTFRFSFAYPELTIWKTYWTISLSKQWSPKVADWWILKKSWLLTRNNSPRCGSRFPLFISVKKMCWVHY